MDPVLGLDTHIVLVPTPAGPVPTPIPMPFIGMVFDPLGGAMSLATGGVVLVNGMPATNVGTAVTNKLTMPHLPVPGPFAKGVPGNDAELMLGSLNVSIGGSYGVRLAEIALSCSDPVRMPTSTVLAIPKGPPVLVMRPPAPDLVAIAKTLAMAGAMRALGKLAKIAKAAQKKSPFWRKLSEKLRSNSGKAGRLKQAWNDAVCFLTGHPVDVATGRLITSQIDVELSGALPLRFERRYDSSASDRSGPLGFGWSHTYDMAVWPERGLVVYRAEDGREIEFSTLHFPDRVLAPGREVYLERERLTVRALGPLHYEIESADGVVREFARVPGGPERVSKLVRMRARLGQELRFGYDHRGLLETAMAASGRSLRFQHDGAGRLTTVHALGNDGTAQLVAGYFYDSAGDLVQAADAFGRPYRFEYVEHLLVQETNRNGLSFYFQYDAVDATARCIRTWGDGGIYDHAITYDTANRKTLVENSLGAVTLYQMDESGQVVSVTDPLGRVTAYEYSADSGQKTKEVDPAGAETLYEYDRAGNLTKIVAPDGATIVIDYSPMNMPVRAVDALGKEWHWGYDRQGRLVGRSDALDRRTQFHWDGPNLIAVTDPSGQHTRLTYDSAGNLTALTTPDAAVSQWQYDGLGRVHTAIDAKGNAQRRERDALGRIVRVHEPDGNVRELAYDGESNVTLARDKHHDVRFEYRGMNRLTARVEAETRVEFVYDNEDQLTAIKNEHGLAYRFVLNAAGEVEEEYGFDDLRRRYLRSAAGQVTTVVRPLNRTTDYTYDKGGRVIAVAHSDGATETYAYRADGELTLAANNAIAVQLERDALGRVIKETQGDAWVTSEFDAIGLRQRIRSSKGLLQTIRRNSMGDVTSIDAGVHSITPKGEASAQPHTTFQAAFQRDALGLELERTLPGGIRARWHRDNIGRPLRHEIWRGNDFKTARQYHWDVNDRLKSVIDALKGPTHYTHDAFGNLAAATYEDGRVDLRMPDAVGNLFRTQERTDRKYGPAGQLLEARTAQGITRYEYDPEGNLVRKVEADGGTWAYEWNGAGMLTRVVRPDGDTVTFAYDALGRRISKTYRGKTTKWIWDGNVPLHEWVETDPAAANAAAAPAQTSGAPEIEAAQRLAELSSQPSQGPPRPNFDAIKRAALGAADIPAAALAAPNGARALAVTPPITPPRDPTLDGTADSPITWLFEPESFAPLAKLVATQRFGIVSDHLGTPIAMFDATGAETWAADIDAYGDLRNVRGDRAACPFRWPGQYEDEETGLYYNRFRYFLAGSGCFTSIDPIGLNGGLRLYAYALDPLAWVDPLGLSKCRNAQQELRAVGKLEGRAAAEIEKDLLARGFKPSPAGNGGTVWTKPMPKGQTAVVRIDPPTERVPARGWADEVPHAHKEIVPTSEVSKRGNFERRPITLDDAAKKSTDPARTHIPIQ
jgi:RHS repeat-associated protein